LDGKWITSFRQAVADGKLVSGSPDDAYAFGKMPLRAFSDGREQPWPKGALDLAQQVTSAHLHPLRQTTDSKTRACSRNMRASRSSRLFACDIGL